MNEDDLQPLKAGLGRSGRVETPLTAQMLEAYRATFERVSTQAQATS